MTPLQLHPENSRYFLFRGEPTLLITSGEHYGAVLNAAFDCGTYLRTLARDGLNHTRVFAGAYCEPVGAFRIARNTLAPAEGQFVCPWARSDQPGYANGGNRFDLNRWDEGYFERLRGFLSRAGDCGVVVEVNLFCPFYRDEMWDLSPMKASNNINGVGDLSREEAYTVDGSRGLLAVQEAMTRKVVEELKDFDNLFYEIMNEPYQGNVPMAWQERIVDAIAATEQELGVRHLVSLNIANGREKVDRVHGGVSILNFHYAWPPDAVAMNYGLGLPIGDNETGFKGTGDFHYRREAWAFILAGGGLYNNLDYSFAVGCEDGTFSHPGQPGGGSAALRAQLRYLKTFMAGFPYIRMAPVAAVGSPPEGYATYALIQPGAQYAIYLCSTEDEPPEQAASVELRLDVPSGMYRFSWLDTLSGELAGEGEVSHGGGALVLSSPPFAGDVALAVTGLSC